MGGASKSKRIQPQGSIPSTLRVRSGKAGSRKANGVDLRRSQTRTACTLSVGRSYSKVSRLGKKNLEHTRSGSVPVKRDRSTAKSRILADQSRNSSLKGCHHPTDKSSSNAKCIPKDTQGKISISKRPTLRPDAHSSPRTSRSPNDVYCKSKETSNVKQSPYRFKSHDTETCGLKVAATKKQSVVRVVNDRCQDAEQLRLDKRASMTAPDIHGAAANVKLIQGDVKVSPTRLASVTGRERYRKRRQLAQTSKSLDADTKDSSNRSYAQVSRSSVRDISLAFSVLAKPPCLMQSTVRPMIPDSNATSGTQHRIKGHDEWDNLEVWGLGRTSWRESVLANSKRNVQPDFDARPGPRLRPEPVPQRSPRLKFSMYNAKPTNTLVPHRRNTRTERRASTRSTSSTSFNPIIIPSTSNHK